MRNIVIVGGGMAGVTAALYSKKAYPQDHVTLVRSDKIGILGAGEGTTKEWVHALSKHLDIPHLTKDFLTQTQATIKYGIMFEDWNSKNYYNGFNHTVLDGMRLEGTTVPADIKRLIDTDFAGVIHYYSKLLTDCHEASFHLSDHLLHEKYKIGTKSLMSNEFNLNCKEYGLHFDVRTKVKYLENIARCRSINIVDGVYVDCEQSEQGDITAIHYIADDVLIKQQCDFVFDCTGFARLILNKKYKQTWISCKNELPVDKAITYKMPHDIHRNGQLKIASGTVARAKNHGWEFVIPVWSEKRCGYLYDSDSCDAEMAVVELEKYYGKKIEITNQFDFQGGFFDRAWQNNCMAVGLSYGFLEPLEATTHHGVIDSLDSMIDRMFDYDTRFVDAWNRKNYNNWCNTRDWLQWHYMCDRAQKDTVFWSKFNSENIVLSDMSKYMLNIHSGVWRPLTGTITERDKQANWHMIYRATVISILHGNKLITNPTQTRFTDSQKQWMQSNIRSTIGSCYDEIDEYVDHYNYLKSMRE